MPKLSLVVPVYNEARQLERVVEKLMTSACPIDREWIFVDDHSTDGSASILENLQQKFQFKLLKQTKNIGKGAAITRGILEATGDFIIIQDADFEYDPNDIPTLLAPLLDDRADVVFGSRFKSNQQVHRTYHYLVNQFLTRISNLLSGIYLTDMETCYKLFRADILQSMRLKSKRFGIEVELTANIAKVRARILELPISYFPRTHLQGKKINWKDGLAALFHLFYFNVFQKTHQAYCLEQLPRHYLTE